MSTHRTGSSCPSGWGLSHDGGPEGLQLLRALGDGRQDGHFGEPFHPVLDDVDARAECVCLLVLCAFDLGRIRKRPVNAKSLAKPDGARLACSCVTDRHNDVRGPTLELAPRLTPQPIGRDVGFLEVLQGQGVDLSHGVAPRAARLQLVTSQVIRDGLGEDAAAAVVGADVQDLHCYLEELDFDAHHYSKST